MFVLDIAPGEGLRGVFVASDWQKRKTLLWFGVNEIIAMFRRVAEDEVVSASEERDSDTGEMTSATGTSASSRSKIVRFSRSTSPALAT